ncbi:MAG: hypothetical protein D8M58_22230 [Calditrichaeota bacterium]|nr:MAG: hypothetical protein DWQ03_08585 [Calditrichota bacterium]KAA3615252.1 MAG: hypothetical protein DWQ03_08620 [Calditrichota bacterium]MBL1208125.1 hypothetical protein [Calditrichota bacterium]MBL1208132.1 hypothetical protein [Calditrichota bacterium]NOG47964.1 hypothetical protein [Calditrichota bacterium]
MILYKIFYIILFLIFISCENQRHKNEGSCVSCVDFLKKVSKENIGLFFNTYIVPRGTNSDGSPTISIIQITTPSDTTFTFPIGEQLIITDDLSEEHRTDILKYANSKGINDWQSAHNYVLKFTTELQRLYYKLNLLEVHSFPHLGEFVEFKISKEDLIIFCPDTSKVFSKKWKSFFKYAEKYGSDFYYKKVSKN